MAKLVTVTANTKKTLPRKDEGERKNLSLKAMMILGQMGKKRRGNEAGHVQSNVKMWKDSMMQRSEGYYYSYLIL